MQPLLPRIFVLLILAILCFTTYVEGQYRAIDHLANAPIEIVLKTPQDSCSKNDLTCMNNGDPAITEPVRYDLRNIGEKAIRSYVVVFLRNRERRIETVTYSTSLPEKGQELYRGYTADRKDEVTITFDYLEFEDGRYWGPDTLSKSLEIDAYRVGRDTAIERLKRLVSGEEYADYFLRQAARSGTASWTDFPDSAKRDRINATKAMGYRNVVSVVAMRSGEGGESNFVPQPDWRKEGAQFARELELMEKDK